MIIIFPKPICKCGSKEISQGCQHHDLYGEFHTKQSIKSVKEMGGELPENESADDSNVKDLSNEVQHQ